MASKDSQRERRRGAIASVKLMGFARRDELRDAEGERVMVIKICGIALSVYRSAAGSSKRESRAAT
jgi:hypothetical protein